MDRDSLAHVIGAQPKGAGTIITTLSEIIDNNNNLQNVNIVNVYLRIQMQLLLTSTASLEQKSSRRLAVSGRPKIGKNLCQ